MVKGLSTDKVVVTDLDGTLIDGNSLHIYIRTALRHVKFSTKIYIFFMLMLRALRIVSHRRMKFGIISRIPATETIKTEFIRRIEGIKNRRITALIEEYRENGFTVVLATAAPDFYVPWIWEGLYVATPAYQNPSMTECRGQLKADEVRRIAGASEIEAVFTDHSDDIPLMRLCAGTNYLVHPSAATRRKVTAAGISFIILED